MTTYVTELSIDFGPVGTRHARWPFSIYLDASALSALIRHAEMSNRIYERLLIERPGDVWAYVDVVIKDAPPSVLKRIQYRAPDPANSRRESPRGPENRFRFSCLGEWQQSGGDPRLVVLGDTRPFEFAGCRDWLQPETEEPAAASMWLQTFLHESRPWTDAIVSLDAPTWVDRVLADWVEHREGPWSPRVVTSGGGTVLHPDHYVEGDLGEALDAAHKRAQRMRLRQL